jgi:nuclear protein localization protein 4 homolog
VERVQSNTDLKEHLRKHSQKSWPQKLADFHLLLWLASCSGLSIDTDLVSIAESVRTDTPVMEGYTMLVDSLAGT